MTASACGRARSTIPTRRLDYGRDLVGELAAAVRAAGLRFGVYYSGGIDWTFNPEPLLTMADFMGSTPGGAYPAYADAQMRELIDRYEPSVLWNDISWPTDEERLFDCSPTTTAPCPTAWSTTAGSPPRPDAIAAAVQGGARALDERIKARHRPRSRRLRRHHPRTPCRTATSVRPNTPASPTPRTRSGRPRAA